LACLAFVFTIQKTLFPLAFTMPKRGAPAAAYNSGPPEWVSAADEKMYRWRCEVVDMNRPKNERWDDAQGEADWYDKNAKPAAGYDMDDLIRENKLARWGFDSRLATFNAQNTTRCVLGRPVQVPLMSDVLVLSISYLLSRYEPYAIGVQFRIQIFLWLT
jgi:hypothetical protein